MISVIDGSNRDTCSAAIHRNKRKLRANSVHGLPIDRTRSRIAMQTHEMLTGSLSRTHGARFSIEKVEVEKRPL